MSSNIFDVVLSTEDKISKAKIKLHKETPFFSYLVEHLRFQESTKVPSMGVDAKGNCYYNKEFVDKLPDSQIKGVIAHEVLHPALRHIQRCNGRNIMVNGGSLWNIAIDIAANLLLVENGFDLPSEGLIPRNNQITVFNSTITDLDNKSAEEIYEELKAKLKQMVEEGSAKVVPSGFTQGDGKPAKGFDEHIQGEEEEEKKEGQGKGDKEQQGKGGNQPEESDGQVPSIDWDKAVSEAYNHAKMIGKSPAGFERMFEELHKSKVNWRTILRRTVASMIPFDHTYRKPNKKYLSHDVYVPSLHGESIKVLVSIDTSGSIGQQELTDFMSEVIGISKSFSQVDFHVLTHDVDVHDDIPVYNGHINTLRNLKLHGGGGTSHIPLYEYIKKKKLSKQTKLLVSFTDGYSDYPERRPNVETIFILAGAHTNKENMPKWGKVICLE